MARVTATLAPVDAARRYQLRPEAGLVAVQDGDAALWGSDCVALQAALAARELDALRAACGPCEPALRRQLRQWLAYHLGSAGLRTRDLVRELQALTTTSR